MMVIIGHTENVDILSTEWLVNDDVDLSWNNKGTFGFSMGKWELICGTVILDKLAVINI